VGNTANVQSSVISQPFDPIDIPDLNERKLIAPADWKTLDYTSTVLVVRDRKKPIKPFEIGLLPVKRQHAPRTVDASRESRVFNWLEEIVERFYVERV
jgi:hypothetical protein